MNNYYIGMLTISLLFQTHLLLFNEETLQPHLNADQPIKTDIDRMNIVKHDYIFKLYTVCPKKTSIIF